MVDEWLLPQAFLLLQVTVPGRRRPARLGTRRTACLTSRGARATAGPARPGGACSKTMFRRRQPEPIMCTLLWTIWRRACTRAWPRSRRCWNFHAWGRSRPTLNLGFKPEQRLSGYLRTTHWQGLRRVTVMVLLDIGAEHRFICARLAATLGLRPSRSYQPGPSSVSTAVVGSGTLGLKSPVPIYLGLSDVPGGKVGVSNKHGRG
jgi:hypothetical protein